MQRRTRKVGTLACLLVFAVHFGVCLLLTFGFLLAFSRLVVERVNNILPPPDAEGTFERGPLEVFEKEGHMRMSGRGSLRLFGGSTWEYLAGGT